MEMPLLICRCCGGELRIDEAREQIVCDYCGEQWGLAALLADTPPLRGGEEEPLHTEMQIYYYAVKRLHASRTVEDCVRLAADFETTPELPDSETLLARCREKAAQLQKERLYLGALARMHSTRPEEAAQAVSWLRQLGDYKDAAAKCAEAEHFLRAAQKKCAAKKCRRVLPVSLLAAVVLLFLLANSWSYAAARLSVCITPDAENFITEAYGDFVFHFAVTVENRGVRDIESFAAEVAMENGQGEILASATLRPVVGTIAVMHAGERQLLSWTLQVDDGETARRLADNAVTMQVRVTVRQITYTSGKIKNY